jgi:hypothetical protein
MIKTFRGLLEDQSQAKIRLSTKKGKIGYRINKFQIIPKNAGTADIEASLKIFKVVQTSITGSFDLSDGNLLAGAFFSIKDNSFFNEVVIFDKEVFNQDIYITHYDSSTGQGMNYYLEVETISLTDNAAAVSTLRDIRLNPQVGA